MKKVNLLILIAVAMFCFISCGAKEEAITPTEHVGVSQNESVDSQPVPDVPESENPVGSISWELRDVKAPHCEDFAVHKVKIYEDADITAKTYDTGINLNHQSIVDIVSGNDWVAKELNLNVGESNGVYSTKWEDSGVVYDTVYGIQYCSEITGQNKDEPFSKYYDDLDFKLEIRRHSWIFNGCDYIFCNVDMGEKNFFEAQNALCQLFTELVGNDFSEYLIYGTDSDNINSADATEKIQLEETVKVGGIPFIFARSVSSDDIYLRIEIDWGALRVRRGQYFQNGNTTFYPEMKYTFADFFDLSTVGGIDSIDGLFSEYWKSTYPDYERSVIENARIARTYNHNGQAIYEIAADIAGGGISAGDISIELSFIEQDNEITDISCEIKGQTAVIDEAPEEPEELRIVQEKTCEVLDKHFTGLFPNANPSLTEQDYMIRGIDGKLVYSFSTGGNFSGEYGGKFEVSFTGTK